MADRCAHPLVVLTLDASLHVVFTPVFAMASVAFAPVVAIGIIVVTTFRSVSVTIALWRSAAQRQTTETYYQEQTEYYGFRGFHDFRTPLVAIE